MQYVTIDKQASGKVAVITMNYKRENRLNPDLMNEIHEALDLIEADADAGAVVLTGGDPKFFCNGLDLEWLMSNFGEPEKLVDYLVQVNRLYRHIAMFPKPLIAALNGHTFAGGLFLAGHADFRFMREDRGWICLPEVDINIPLLPGMIAVCRAAMPPASFHKLYYSGGRFTGPQAVEMGFVEAVFPEQDLIPKSVEFAAMLAAKRTTTFTEFKKRAKADVIRILDEVDPGYLKETLTFTMQR